VKDETLCKPQQTDHAYVAGIVGAIKEIALEIYVQVAPLTCVLVSRISKRVDDLECPRGRRRLGCGGVTQHDVHMIPSSFIPVKPFPLIVRIAPPVVNLFVIFVTIFGTPPTPRALGACGKRERKRPTITNPVLKRRLNV
jgi:hypothetical protein